MLKEIRIHGRGGQGVVTAAELIAIAAFKDGHQAQAFPSFGVERTGAPIEAFARISDRPIRIREHVYRPDFLIVQDASLIGTVDIAAGAKDETMVIVNSAKDRAALGLKLPAERIVAIDATKIALDIIGKNLMNTVILGALARVSGLLSPEALKAAIEDKFGDKGKEIVAKNIQAIEKAYEMAGDANPKS